MRCFNLYKIICPILIFILLIGCSANKEETPSSLEVQTGKTNSESMLQQLNIPWSIAKTDNTFFISEREGKIVQWNMTSGKRNEQSLYLKEQIHIEGEGGLLGIALLPNFSVNNEMAVYHTYLNNGRIKNRLIKIKLEDNKWIEEEVLLDNIPGARFHNGGRVKIGPDKKLYITTGDALEPELAQNKNSLAGKILRMELDGSIPKDNPFIDSYVYSYGHRNPQGLVWDESGRLFSTEHGQSAHDEINYIKKGKNYGWPIIEGDEQKVGMETPYYHTDNQTWAPSGVGYDKGRLYIAALAGSAVMSFDIETGESRKLIAGYGRMRDVLIEDGILYAITSNLDGRGKPSPNDDQLIKFNIQEGENGY